MSSLISRKRSANATGSPAASPLPPAAPSAESNAAVDWLIFVAAALAACGLLATLCLTGCTIERVVLYETVNYPAPSPT